MRESRATVAWWASTIKSRVELLPQSSAATASVTNVQPDEFWYADFSRHEFADGVVGASQIVREVRVEALHANTCAAHATTRLRCIESHARSFATRGVFVVRSLERGCIDEIFEAVNAAVTLDATHGGVHFRIDEPKQCGHWGSVTHVRLVLDHDGPSIGVTHDDCATTGQGTAEQGFDNGEVVEGRVVESQRQNSRVRTRRDTKAFTDE